MGLHSVCALGAFGPRDGFMSYQNGHQLALKHFFKTRDGQGRPHPDDRESSEVELYCELDEPRLVT
jgi:hypothetical protein